MTSQLVWFELPVGDLDRGREFFGELFGWQFDAWGEEPYNLVKEAAPGGALMQGDGRPVVYFSTSDIDTAVARLRELGGEADDIQEVPGVGRMTSCRDDQGTRFSLFQQAG